MKTTFQNYKQHQAELSDLLNYKTTAERDANYSRIVELTHSIDAYVDGQESQYQKPNYTGGI
jgi:hypothetical protein